MSHRGLQAELQVFLIVILNASLSKRGSAHSRHISCFVL